MKDIYRIGSMGRVRLIIRNQWHEWGGSKWSLIECTKLSIKNTLVIHITIFGFQLVIFIETKRIKK